MNGIQPTRGLSSGYAANDENTDLFFLSEAIISDQTERALQLIEALPPSALCRGDVIRRRSLLVSVLEHNRQEIALALIEKLPPAALIGHFLDIDKDPLRCYIRSSLPQEVTIVLMRRIAETRLQALYRQNPQGYTYLHEAISLLKIEAALVLIEILPIDAFSIRGGDGHTPLTLASELYSNGALPLSDFRRLLIAFNARGILPVVGQLKESELRQLLAIPPQKGVQRPILFAKKDTLQTRCAKKLGILVIPPPEDEEKKS